MPGLRTSELTYKRAEDNGGQEMVTFVVSTEAPASDGGILRAKGVDLAQIKRNPVVLYGHDDGYSAMSGGKSLTGGLPIGRIAATRVVDSPLGKKTAVEQDFIPATQPDQDSEMAKTFRFIWSLVRDNFLRMASVRFRVTEFENLTREQLGKMGLPEWGFVGRKWTPWETSLCSIGADPGAVVKRAWESGKYDNDDLDRLVRLARPEPIIIGERSEEPDPPTPEPVVDTGLADSLRALNETISGLTKTVEANTAEVRANRAALDGLLDELTNDDDEDHDHARSVANQGGTQAEPASAHDVEAEATRAKELENAIAASDAALERMREISASLRKKGN